MKTIIFNSIKSSKRFFIQSHSNYFYNYFKMSNREHQSCFEITSLENLTIWLKSVFNWARHTRYGSKWRLETQDIAFHGKFCPNFFNQKNWKRNVKNEWTVNFNLYWSVVDILPDLRDLLMILRWINWSALFELCPFRYLWKFKKMNFIMCQNPSYSYKWNKRDEEVIHVINNHLLV